MGTEEWQTFCPQCGQMVLGRRQMPNHVLHFLVAFLTCGLWVVPWVVVTVAATGAPYLCPHCGSEGTNA